MSKNLVIDGMRGYLIDFHRNDLPQVSFKGFDKEKIRRVIRESNIDNLILYAKDHWGYAYYPSKIGPVHPKLLEAGFDFLREVMEAAESEGVDVCVYYSVDTDNFVIGKHPEWKVLDPFGNPVRAGGRWIRCSIVLGYEDYALSQIEEILSMYHPKGMFFDAFPSVLCFCEECRKRYKAVTGKDMPTGRNADENWRDLHRYEEAHYWLPFAKRLRSLFDRVSPGTKLTTNGCNPNMPESIRDLYDYHFDEPWAGNYISAGFGRDVMKSPQIGPGNVGMVYDDTPVEVIRRELISIGMQGARPSLYSESMNNDASMVEHEWERIGLAFDEIRKIEGYWKDAEFLSDIDIVYSQSSHMFAPDRVCYVNNWWERRSKHLDDIQSAMALSASVHRGYRIIQGDKLTSGDSLDIGSLAVIPNAAVMAEASWKTIADHVSRGGRAVVVLSSLPKDEDGNAVDSHVLEELLGCKLVGDDERFAQNGTNNFIKFKEESPCFSAFGKLPLGVVGTRLTVEADAADVWADYFDPVLEVDFSKEIWMAWRPPNPGTKACGPAILHHRYGKGEVVFITFDIFGMAMGKLAAETGFAVQESQKWYWPVKFFSFLASNMAPAKIRVDGVQENVYVSFMKKKDELFVHILNNESMHGIYKGESRIILDKEYYPVINEASQIYPLKKPINIENNEDFFEISIESSALYTIISIK